MGEIESIPLSQATPSALTLLSSRLTALAAFRFEDAVWDLVERDERAAGKKLWYREDRWPQLGAVRGKLVMLCRFGFESKQGLHPVNWPNNSPVVSPGFPCH